MTSTATDRSSTDAGHPGLRLPPGQRPVVGFPRFGTHLHHPAPTVPADHGIGVHGAVTRPVRVSLPDLGRLPRREQRSDLHCVAGWSAVGLTWEGVPFAAFWREVVEPALDPAAVVTHLVFGGLDGHRSVATIEDALGDDVMIAEHLDGRPLDGDHGAPVRLVSPSQYGYISTKHLSHIEVRTSAPTDLNRSPAQRILEEHPRARVWEEERHGSLPGRLVRPVYHLLIPPIRYLSALGAARREGPGPADR